MTLLRSVRAQASGSRVGANLAPVSQTNEESDLGGGGRFDRNVCRAAESDCDGGIYVELTVHPDAASGYFKYSMSFVRKLS